MKRKKEQSQQRKKANFLQLFSRAKGQGLEIESDKESNKDMSSS